MRQVAQRPRDGRVSVVEVPTPSLRPGWVLVRNRFSLISAGTERSKIEMGDKSILAKARARPDLVRKVVDRARVEGVRAAAGATRERLDALAPIGYSSAGVVIRLGEGVEGLAPGDRVACGGGGWANHAEVVAVPRNLVARLGDAVPLESAAYATVGAIAMHGVRRAEVAVGERVGVIGLGLVGQLAARILDAAGCEPFGVDLDPAAVDLAVRGGAQGFVRDQPGLAESILEATSGAGLDAVLICAATESADPLALGAQLLRDRGRLVVVGDVPIEADRALLYEKEIDLRLSRSYGPGRYDADYEERGTDLPPGYVRWTEQRNMQSFVDLIAAGKLDPSGLTTHTYAVEDAPEAYATLSGAAERPFGILLAYPSDDREPPATRARVASAGAEGRVRIGLVGAGAFARGTLLPALSATDARLVSVVTAGGLSSADVTDRFGFERAAERWEDVVADEDVDALMVANRHAGHARIAAAALRAGKSVFVEKPLALTEAEVADVEEALGEGGGVLMVGFNRRFAPLVERLRAACGDQGGRVVSVRVNAGPLPADHWLHDPQEGGGRLLGEGCHFVDLLEHLAGAPTIEVSAQAVPQPTRALECSDEFVVMLRFANGNAGSLVYSGAGDSRLAKERIEVFGGGLSAVLDDFKRLELFRDGKREVTKARQDKGHSTEIRHFVRAVSGEVAPPPVESYLSSTRATLAIAHSLRSGEPATCNER